METTFRPGIISDVLFSDRITRELFWGDNGFSAAYWRAHQEYRCSDGQTVYW